MTTMNISLPDDMKTFVDNQITKGGFSTVSEYVRDLIRQDRKRAAEAKLEALLLEGINSGDPIEVTPQFWKELREKAERRLSERTSGQ